MPKGGRRVGAGRPPSARRTQWLKGDPGKRNLAMVEAPVDAGQRQGVAALSDRDIPATLTLDESAYWRLWAGAAESNGTLTDATKPGFVLLCQVARRAAQIWAEIEAVGFTYEKVTIDGAGKEHVELKSHPLLTHYRGLAQRQEQLLARYGLAAFGKVNPQAQPKPDDERDTLAQLLAVR